MLAYLDAGSGSLIASAIVAGFAGVAVVFKTGFRKVGLLFSPKRRREAKQAREAEEAKLAAATASAADEH